MHCEGPTAVHLIYKAQYSELSDFEHFGPERVHTWNRKLKKNFTPGHQNKFGPQKTHC